MATKSYDKEYLLCLTLAYFAKHPNFREKKHSEKFHQLFTISSYAKDYPGIAKRGDMMTKETLAAIKKAKKTPSVVPSLQRGHDDVKRGYGMYLSPLFDYEKVLRKFSNKITPAAGTLKIHDSTKKVYNQVYNLCMSNIIPAHKLSEYEFLDQNDVFMMVVKNQTLKKIVDVMGLGKTNPELLNPADIMIVKRSDKQKIVADIQKHFLNASNEEILGNMVTRTFSYRKLLQEYMQKKQMYGVSHKLPSTITGAKRPSIIGEAKFGSNAVQQAKYNEFIDPFGQLLAILLTKPNETDSVIDRMLTIEFQNFDIRENIASWTMPVRFHYDKVFPQHQLATAHLPKSMRLKLLNWFRAGFNGKWEIDGKDGTWIAGMGAMASIKLFDKYDETIMQEVAKKRIDVFRSFFGEIPAANEDHHALYMELYHRFSRKEILRPNEKLSDKLERLIRKMGLSITPKTVFGTIIETFLKELPKRYQYKNTPDYYIASHTAHVQFSYFIYRGGPKYQLKLKKRIILSLYGIISKSAYKIFPEGSHGLNKQEANSYFTAKFRNPKGEELMAEYHVAPYLLVA
jgi:hypothetical protein